MFVPLYFVIVEKQMLMPFVRHCGNGLPYQLEGFAAVFVFVLVFAMVFAMVFAVVLVAVVGPGLSLFV